MLRISEISEIILPFKYLPAKRPTPETAEMVHMYTQAITVTKAETVLERERKRV